MAKHKIKAIKIDAEKREIYEIEIDCVAGGCLFGMYEAIGCRMVELVRFVDLPYMEADTGKKENENHAPKVNDFWVDEEGRINGNPRPYFHFLDHPDWGVLKGNALVTGCDLNTGNSCSHKADIEYLKKNVRFMTDEQTKKLDAQFAIF